MIGSSASGEGYTNIRDEKLTYGLRKGIIIQKDVYKEMDEWTKRCSQWLVGSCSFCQL